jgi:hypothetical protein
MPPAVARAIHPGRARAGKEDIGIDRIDGQRPDRRQVALGADPLPVLAAIMADKEAGIAAGIDGTRLLGMATSA